MSDIDKALAYAAERGAKDGKNAAEWYVHHHVWVPYNRSAAARILKGIEDGDPAVQDTFPTPDLSGERADTLTGPQLVDDALRGAVLIDGEDPFTDICDAYEAAYSQAVEDEIARAARVLLEPR